MFKVFSVLSVKTQNYWLFYHFQSNTNAQSKHPNVRQFEKHGSKKS